MEGVSDEARMGYRAVAFALRRRIEEGEFPLGSYLPTERELQDLHGVSRTTVRRALAWLVEIGWGEALPGRGVIAARGFRRSSTGQVALIDNDSYVARMLQVRMRDGLAALGLEPVMLGEAMGYSMEDALQKAVDDRFVAALVWSYEGFPDPELVARVNRHIPVIALDHRLEGADGDLVTFDYEQAAYDATAHLAQQGCRRIGVVGMLDMLEITHARFRGYLRAMFAHGLQPLPRDFLFVATSGHNQSDISILEHRLRSGDRPEGILVMQDGHAPDTVAAALRAGLNLPHDLRIAMLGDDLEISVDGTGMTAVRLDWDEFIETSLALLTDRLENLQAPPVTRHVAHRLIVRGLCGARRENWTPLTELSAPRLLSVPTPLPSARFTSRWRADIRP